MSIVTGNSIDSISLHTAIAGMGSLGQADAAESAGADAVVAEHQHDAGGQVDHVPTHNSPQQAGQYTAMGRGQPSAPSKTKTGQALLYSAAAAAASAQQ